MVTRQLKYFSIVPRLSDSEPNPEMYCNLARENPMVEKCLDCKEKCKHSGKKTVFMRQEIKFGG